jgi:hypothetical protein
MKRHFFFKENFQMICFQRSKTHSEYINVLLHYNIVFRKDSIESFDHHHHHHHHQYMGFYAF